MKRRTGSLWKISAFLAVAGTGAGCTLPEHVTVYNGYDYPVQMALSQVASRYRSQSVIVLPPRSEQCFNEVDAYDIPNLRFTKRDSQGFTIKIVQVRVTPYLSGEYNHKGYRNWTVRVGPSRSTCKSFDPPLTDEERYNAAFLRMIAAAFCIYGLSLWALGASHCRAVMMRCMIITLVVVGVILDTRRFEPTFEKGIVLTATAGILAAVVKRQRKKNQMRTDAG